MLTWLDVDAHPTTSATINAAKKQANVRLIVCHASSLL